MRDEKGFALVLTLIITTLMVAALVELIHQVTVDISLSRSYRDGQQGSLLAESGVTGAMKLLQMSLQGRNYTSLSDAWATPIRQDDETGSIDVSIVEESGRINLNGLIHPNGDFTPFIQAALLRLGTRQKIPVAVWSALADWLDSDDQTRPNGAETPYYQTQIPPYTARNGPLATIAELSLVKGFTPGIIAGLKPFVTIYSDQPGAPVSKVNINTAPEEVLEALDDNINDTMAEQIISARSIKPFLSPGDLSRISGGEAISQRLVGNVSVMGSIFQITSIARVRDTARTIVAEVRMSGGAPVLLSWQEY